MSQESPLFLKTKDHPERESDEYYLGNYNKQDFESFIGWKTKRKGEVPCDIKGNIIESRFLFPVFVKKTEMERANNGGFSFEE